MKKSVIIVASDVPRIFDYECSRELADMVELPPDLRKSFAKALRRLACVFIRDRNIANDDDVTGEIKALYAAAERHQYTDGAKLVTRMSKPTRVFLNKRAIRIHLTIPKPSAFLDRARRQAACETLRRITSQGGHREGGKWVPHLYLPKRQLAFEERALERIRPAEKAAAKRKINIMAPIRRKAIADVTAEMVKDAERRGVELELRSPKRKPETDFINGLQVAVYNITGVEPPVTARTADATGTFSPFVQMAQKCLELMGADDRTDAGGSINKLRARYPKKRSSRKKGRKPRK
jgi:hypothetical protein